ncbi:MAG: small ribosomal subunit biogenesis GTPase RsgA [Pseudohongiellaceae bacterium]|nr:small ribosomal subunit biogenesis GTPase RsgA [Pseudohongiellaceae bacterium]
MSKRRLTQQQRTRISRNQAQRQKKLNANNVQERSSEDLGPEQTGIIICHYGQQLELESTDPSSLGKIYRCFQRTNLPALATGDRVIWQADGEDSGVVVALQERTSLMARPNQQGVLRPVAANISVVAIVIAPLPEPFPNLVDRYLVMAESLSLKPLIILNKVDILDAERDVGIEKMLSIYQDVGYPVLRLSSKKDLGTDALKDFLAQQTVVFVGQSGVGKSSLINTLRGELEDEQDAAVGAMSAARDKGTHTTTAARLYHLPGSGDLVDSPGIREFGLWHMDEEMVFDGYREFAPYKGLCRFRDCSHRQEPGCAILQAEQEGKIHPERLASYFFLLNSLD